jgi:hypothetical protein
MVKKIAKQIGFLGKFSRKLTSRTKIIQPHFDYCSLIIFMANEGRCAPYNCYKIVTKSCLAHYPEKVKKNKYQIDAGCIGHPLNQTTSEDQYTYIDFQN